MPGAAWEAATEDPRRGQEGSGGNGTEPILEGMLCPSLLACVLHLVIFPPALASSVISP